MYVDLCVKPGSMDELKAIVDTALRLNYSAIAVEVSGNDLGDVGGNSRLAIIHRRTCVGLTTASRVRRDFRDTLLVYELSDVSMLRSLDRLRGRFQMIKLTDRVLANLKQGYVKKLRNCGIPVEVVFNEVIVSGRLSSGFLRGFSRIIPYVEGGDIDLILSSGARDFLDLLHPMVAIALLKELGLSYLTSLKALTTSPKRVLEGICS